jgi:uncharacterized protein
MARSCVPVLRDIRQGAFLSMLHAAALAVLFMVATFAGTAAADPLKEGSSAYLRGDYATAHQLLYPLADQGDATAQVFLGLMYKNGQGRAAGLFRGGEVVSQSRRAGERECREQSP